VNGPRNRNCSRADHDRQVFLGNAPPDHYATLVWCALLVTYLAIWGRPTSLSEAIATNLLLLMGGVIGSYVFGAVWDDASRRKTEFAQQAVDQGQTDTSVEVKP
jgi:hypothetical protein